MLTQSSPRVRHLRGLSPHGFHRVVYFEWGASDNPDVVICVHGVGRNARDFDVLGEALASTHRVLAVDMPGRGESDWLADPADYVFPVYLATLTALIARSEYFGKDPTFATYDEIGRYLREISAPFGPLTDAQWAYLTRTNVRKRADGRWGLAYDPAIAVPFRQQPAPPSLWSIWDAIACPTLVLRGAQSDLLQKATANEMAARGPRPRVLEFAGIGHAPMLLTRDQVDPVVAFLRAVDSR